MLAHLAEHLAGGTPLNGTTEERLLQGPLADAMTHVGQLAVLRRLSGDADGAVDELNFELYSLRQ